MERKVNKTIIKLLKGDIADQDTEAIVNAANNHLWMGSGVAGSIKKTGGIEIEREAISKGPIEIGQAVLTGGGKLKATFVIHAAAMGVGPVNIENATKSTFQLIRENGIKSVSFPALATGVAQFPIDHCAKIMLGISIEVAKEKGAPEEIRFLLWTNEDLKIFERILKNYLKE